jgi:hypothetical protein
MSYNAHNRHHRAAFSARGASSSEWLSLTAGTDAGPQYSISRTATLLQLMLAARRNPVLLRILASLALHLVARA